MDQLFARLEQADPSWHKDSGIGVEPLHEYVIGPLRGGLMMLLGAVGLVLLIACVNVASLVVARAAARAREVGIRAALGAGSGRLIRLFVIESLVLASLGTFCAILCATWTIPLLRDALPEGMPRAEEIALNLRVLAAAGGVTLLTALFFGVMPARPLRGPDLALPLKSSTRAGLADLRAHRLRDLLVIAELALAVILLVGAALFTMGLTPRTDPTGKRPDPAAAFEQVVERLATVPGVMHAAIVWGGLPLRGGTHIRAFQVLGRPVASDDVGVNARHVTPDYHRSLGIPLRKGRMLEPSDDASALKVIVIGEAVASRYFPAEDPIGRSAVIGETAWTIVGVVGDVHDRSVETERRPLVYFPMAQSTAGPAELVVRTAAEPYDAFPAVKAALLEVMPDVSIRNVTTVGEIQVRQRGSRRLRMLIMGLFGAVGLAVSAVGLYGLMAFLVSRRTHEFGVRIALGATPERLIGTVLAHGGVIVAIGLAIGGVGAWLLRSVAESMLFPGLQSGDPRAFAAAIGVLSLSAVLAMLIPARRATRVDAVVVLRLE
jgi:putative ABC transport system permease protein